MKSGVSNSVNVEEDGRFWLLVKSKMKNWEDRDNISVELNFAHGNPKRNSCRVRAIF
jgi:hypothetical protein